MKPRLDSSRVGCDSPAYTRSEDYLDRWPMAEELFRVATTGPKEWSVRIGVYGQWGTGKSSVLNFIESIAREGNHVVVRFNPWEFSDGTALWHSFVAILGAALGLQVSNKKPPLRWRIKGFFYRLLQGGSPRREEIASFSDSIWLKGSLLGLDILKTFLAYTHQDVRALLNNGGDKRLLVLIDDLDRTSASVVPEILFALKEVLDLPGVAFVCAFDPKVVGEVLGVTHPGFGKGLGFLEKIIDYPKWLSSPEREHLQRLAVATAKLFAPYVPEEALRTNISLLPANPRAIRQFIRLISLLGPQISRHYEYELNWTAILAANALKIRHPMLSHSLLNDATFWESLQLADFAGDEAAKKIPQLINEHIDDVLKLHNDSDFSSEDRTRVSEILQRLSSEIQMFSHFDVTALQYQMHIGEAPHAVTWKEFDALFSCWHADPAPITACDWIANHARVVGRSREEVFRECVDATLRRYRTSLQELESELDRESRENQCQKSRSLLSLLRCLTCTLPTSNHAHRIDNDGFEALVEVLLPLQDRTDFEDFMLFRREEAEVLSCATNAFASDVERAAAFLKPFYPTLSREYGPLGKALYTKLVHAIVPRLAAKLLHRFLDQGFVSNYLVEGRGTYEGKRLLCDVDAPLWNTLRGEVVQFFSENREDERVRSNVFEFLYFALGTLIEERGSSHGTMFEKLLRDQDLAQLLWRCLTSKVLNQRIIFRLQKFPELLQSFNVTVPIPVWWTETLLVSQNGLQKMSKDDVPR